MKYTLRRILATCLLSLSAIGAVSAQTAEAPPAGALAVHTYRPLYLPPDELIAFLGAVATSNGLYEYRVSDSPRRVEIRRNQSANLVVLTGEVTDISFVLSLLKEADIAPRQIEIEVKIIEINTARARNIGLDWQQILDRTTISASGQVQADKGGIDKTIRRGVLSVDSRAYDFIKAIDSTGAGSVRTAPRVVTVNNRAATILDGKRMTYVTRYSAYSNLYETDSMDAGLTLRVIPSLGESGYLTLKVSAELTELDGSVGNSPVKDGQMIENTVVVRDGESVLLGGRTKTIERKYVKRFPVLGWVIPYLFSRHTTSYSEVESFIILTPRVIDLVTTLDDDAKSAIEGQ